MKNEEESKRCKGCGETKPLSLFSKKKDSKDGFKTHCKSCNKNERERQKEKRAAYAQDWYQVNKERLTKRRKEYYQANKTAIRAYGRQYKQNNRAYINASVMKRNAVKLKATPQWAKHDKIEEFYEVAQAFKMYTGASYHVDHIVPLQGHIVCGLHCEANLQVLEAQENFKKTNRRWPDMP